MKERKRAFSNVRVLTASAMLTALSIVIGIFCKNLLNFGFGLFRITFENFPIILSGIMFGPIVGSCVGIVADVLSYILSTQTLAISPLVTLGAASVGCVSGLVSHYFIKQDGAKRIIFSATAAHLVGSVIIKSIGLYFYYGFLVAWRIPLYALIATLEITIICLMNKNKNFHALINYKGDIK